MSHGLEFPFGGKLLLPIVCAPRAGNSAAGRAGTACESSLQSGIIFVLKCQENGTAIIQQDAKALRFLFSRLLIHFAVEYRNCQDKVPGQSDPLSSLCRALLGLAAPSAGAKGAAPVRRELRVGSHRPIKQLKIWVLAPSKNPVVLASTGEARGCWPSLDSRASVRSVPFNASHPQSVATQTLPDQIPRFLGGNSWVCQRIKENVFHEHI